MPPPRIPESRFTVSTTVLGPILLKEGERSREFDWVKEREVDWVRERARASSYAYMVVITRECV